MDSSIFNDCLIIIIVSFKVINKTLTETFISNHRRYSVRKSVLKNFSKLTGKHLSQSSLFNKVLF